MKLDLWLQEATEIFPQGVRERLAEEYAAHLEDSVAAGESEDALELFGDPRAAQQLLKKTYLQQGQFSSLKQRSSWAFWILLGATLCTSKLESAIKLDPQSLLTVFSILMAFFLIWHFTKRQQRERRVLSRYFLAFAVYSLLFVEQRLFARAISLTGVLLGGVSLAALLLSVAPALAQDKRLRRTLELEEISFEKRRINLHPDR